MTEATGEYLYTFISVEEYYEQDRTGAGFEVLDHPTFENFKPQTLEP